MVTGNILFPLFDEISRKDMKIDDNMPFVVNKRAPENYYRTRPYIKTRPHRGSRVPCLTPTKMVAILNFPSFCKTQKCLYLENRAIWSELNKIFDLLGISAE